MDEHELQHLRQHKDESFRHEPHSASPADEDEAGFFLKFPAGGARYAR